MNVLSLFDGMSCGQIALERAGIKVDNYYASEIDTHAIKVTMANYPNTIQLGDVTKVFAKDLPKIDIIIGGSPCQGFSFAGKGLNFEDPRSKLFFEFVRLIKECKPKYFLLENVKMKYEHELVISKYLGVEPIEINSALVSAQNRVRLYWTNINQKPYGLFGDIKADIPQPKDRKIYLKDILQESVDEKYYLSQTALNRIFNKVYSSPQINPEKTGCINTKNNSGQLSVDNGTTLITDNAIGRNVEMHSSTKTPPLRSHAGCSHDNKVLLQNGHGKNKGGIHEEKSPTVLSNSWEQNNHIVESTCVAQRGRYIVNGKRKDYNGAPTEQRLEENNCGKTICLSTVQKDNLIREVRQLNPSTESGGRQPYQPNRIYDPNGLSPCLNIDHRSPMIQFDKSPCLHGFEHGTNGQFNNSLVNKGLIRRLTEIECERLQCVPDGYTDHVSSTQRYKMLGNGWNIDTIVHILKFISV